MNKKIYIFYLFKKFSILSLTAYITLFLIVFQPLSVLAQDFSSLAKETSDESFSKETNENYNEVNPKDNNFENSNKSEQKNENINDNIEQKSEYDEKPSESGDDRREDFEDPDEKNRDNGAPEPTIQTQVVSENIKREKTVNLKDGSFLYEYGLFSPPGRNLTPSLSIIYNSNNIKKGSIIGTGWSLDIPFIERLNKNGSENIYTNGYFYSSLTGELVLDGGTNYVSKIDNGEFLYYEYDNNFWIVYDKNGIKYTFGQNINSRQDDPNNSSRVYRWMIEEIRDKNDNYIKFEYYKDNGQIYPLIITYTGNGTTDGIFEVIFERESLVNPTKLYDTGFAVITNDRISEIRMEVDGDWVRKYELSYTTSDNNEEILLGSIIESGKDQNNNTVTRDPMNFTYTSSTPGWNYDSSWELPLPFIDNGDFGLRVADMNGDGLPDIVCYGDYNNGNCGNNNMPVFYLNTGIDFIYSSGLGVPEFVGNNNEDLGVRILDVNGDGLNDVIRSDDNNYNEVYINNGSQLLLDTSWTLPIPVVHGTQDYGMRLADINGDGLPDILCHNDDPSSGSYVCTENDPRIYINNGSGWVLSNIYQFPPKQDEPTELESFLNSNLESLGLHIGDINGDGLADLIRGHDTSMFVYINNGSGWEYESIWDPPLGFMESEDTGSRLEDINGDNLLDIVCHGEYTSGLCDTNNPAKVYMNLGSGWNSVNGWGGPKFVKYDHSDNGFRFIDINGDGLSDVVEGDGSDINTYINNSQTKADLLSGIIYPEGGTTEISYKTTTQFRDPNNNLLNPNLPMINIVVSKIIDNDMSGNISERSYEYAGGEYYFDTYLDRKFAGFSVVTEIDPLGNVTKTYFHQGNDTNEIMGEYDDKSSKIGKPYRVEKYDDSNNLYNLSVNKWEEYETTPETYFVYNSISTSLNYDGNSDHRDKASQYEFDTLNGNLISKISYGEVIADSDGAFIDIGNDMMVEEYSYAIDSNNLIRSKVSNYIVTDQNSNIVREEKFYYDNQTIGNIILGNLTKEERLISGSDYAKINKVYDGVYGLVVESYDSLNNITEYDYDIYNLYPENITNALAQTTTYEYDYSIGKPINITDPNGIQKEYIYDGFDRIIQENESSPTLSTVLLTKNEYSYNDNSGQISVTKTEYYDGVLSRDIYKYFDGFGRLIQERSKAENANTFNVKDTIYDVLGRISHTSLPYTDLGNSFTNPTTNGDLIISNNYDALGRVIENINATGTTTYTYDNWMTTIINQNGIPKDLMKDAYERLTSVIEHNNSNTYETNYKWDLNGKLIKIEDSLGNVRNFEYDGLGRRIFAEDLHAIGDNNFGTREYTYDSVGNLIEYNDPNGATISFIYDEINRVNQEDSNTTNGIIDIIYSYDFCPNGVGRLCKMENAQNIVVDYSYLGNGKIRSEIRNIDGEIFDMAYTYDRQGNIDTIQNPDRSVVDYTRNEAGLIEKIEEMEDGSIMTDFISDINYGPHNLPTEVSYYNGVITTNYYDDTKMYRLEKILTSSPGSGDIQDVNYIYDNMGNIINISDTSATTASKEVEYIYDDLDRLIAAIVTNTGNSADYTLEYEYDSIGNIINHSVLGQYQYQGNGPSYANPHAVTDIGLTVLEYDINGNLTGDGVTSNTWTYRNELLETSGSGGTLNFLYDHEGQRMYVSDGNNIDYYPNRYYNKIAGIPTKNIYLEDTLLGTIEDSGINAIYHYNHTDHLTGSNVTTDISGSLEQTLDYFPFGELRINDQATTFDQGRKFTGHIYDEETGLSYMGARYYDGRLGRFTSQDPAFLKLGDSRFEQEYQRSLEQHLVNPQALNSYSYALNNPIKHTDPSGEIVPLLALAVLALTAYDTYDTARTVMDSNVSAGGKALAVGLWVSPLGEAKTVAKGVKEGGEMLYRAMKEGADGLPRAGQSASTLGVRPGKDIPIDSNGMVSPGTGGMSVSPASPLNIGQNMRPESLGGAGKNPAWCISCSSLPEGLNYRPDPTNAGHGFIEPSKSMSFDNYKSLIETTQKLWKKN